MSFTFQFFIVRVTPFNLKPFPKKVMLMILPAVTVPGLQLSFGRENVPQLNPIQMTRPIRLSLLQVQGLFSR